MGTDDSDACAACKVYRILVINMFFEIILLFFQYVNVIISIRGKNAYLKAKRKKKQKREIT